MTRRPNKLPDEPMLLQALRDNPPWIATLLTALLAALAALTLHSTARAVLRRMTAHTVIPRAMLEYTERRAARAAPLVAMQLVWGAAPDSLVHIATVRHFNGLLLIVALTALAMGAIKGLGEGLIRSHPVDTEDNLRARRVATQTRVLARTGMVLILIGGLSMALMTFPGARQLGASLLASAGVLGIVGGLAAKPVFSNLIAGLQLAVAQPIRIDDALIVKGEFGHVEEITGTYVVMKLWDERRMIVPLQWFIENPFENWTRTSSQILGSLFLWVDYATPIEPLRAEAKRLIETMPEWDQRVFNVQVTETTDRAVQVRVLVSAQNSGKNFDLRCKLREGLLAFVARNYPECLPRLRAEQLAAEWASA
jgi:small-conductance mechanosensitive channel